MRYGVCKGRFERGEIQESAQGIGSALDSPSRPHQNDLIPAKSLEPFQLAEDNRAAAPVPGLTTARGRVVPSFHKAGSLLVFWLVDNPLTDVP